MVEMAQLVTAHHSLSTSKNTSARDSDRWSGKSSIADIGQMVYRRTGWGRLLPVRILRRDGRL
jgi:hypothetical protein